jgi:hypothetical protein
MKDTIFMEEASGVCKDIELNGGQFVERRIKGR